jgi:hypothetical protein
MLFRPGRCHLFQSFRQRRSHQKSYCLPFPMSSPWTSSLQSPWRRQRALRSAGTCDAQIPTLSCLFACAESVPEGITESRGDATLQRAHKFALSNWQKMGSGVQKCEMPCAHKNATALKSETTLLKRDLGRL